MFNTTLAAATIIAAVCVIFTVSFVRICRALDEYSKSRQSGCRTEQPGFRPYRHNDELETRRFRTGLVALATYTVGMVLSLYMMALHQSDGQFTVAWLTMLVLCCCFAALATRASLQEDCILERFAAQLPS